jgi:outer membrane receptor protein involved in Fe transport
MFNASIDYALGKFRGNVRYAYRSAYLTAIGDNKYVDDTFAARDQIDLDLSYRLTRRLRLSANVINVTANPQVSYQSFPANVEDNSYYGRRATLGIDYTF